MKRVFSKEIWTVLFICLIFTAVYLTLSLVRHNHFLSGYDLAFVNQFVYGYSHFKIPISTVGAYAFTPSFYDHIEFIYVFLSPFYWIFSDARTLIILQAIFVGISGIPIFLLARGHKINSILSFALLISYLSFYGIQNAIWYDVHSLVFAAVFLAFFVYFLDAGKKWLTILFFVLAITRKEDIAFLTTLILTAHFFRARRKLDLALIFISVIFLFALFNIFYPHFTPGYRFGEKGGVLVNINPNNFINTIQKREVIVYSLGWFGFLPLLFPVYLIPFFGDLFHYFVLGIGVNTAQDFFYHYRVTLAIFLIWPTILGIEKFKKLNNKYLAFYILFWAALFTYILHTPFTYLTKQWFWVESPSVKNINKMLSYLPANASVVSQNNITPHISNRDNDFTLFADVKGFKDNSPCGKPQCAWFKWAGNPQYLVVDTSSEWNILQLLANRPDFIKALNNMEKTGTIKKYKQIGSAIMYTVEKRPFP